MSPAVRRPHIDLLWMQWELNLAMDDSWPPQEWILAGGN